MTSTSHSTSAKMCLITQIQLPMATKFLVILTESELSLMIKLMWQADKFTKDLLKLKCLMLKVRE